MTLETMNIVVVGAGIGGLAAALALRQAGAHVTLLEQAEAITEVGAGLQISPNGYRVMSALGLGPALDQAGLPARAVSLRDYVRGRELVRMPLIVKPGEAPYLFLHRADLIDVLSDAVRRAGVDVRLLQKVAEVTPGSRPCLRMHNGDRLSADLVVGADGLHSVVRPALNGQDAPFFTGQVAWRAIVPNTHDHPRHARLHMGPGRHFVSYPLRDATIVNIVAVQERTTWAEEGWHNADDPNALRAAFADFCPEVHQLLAGLDEVRLWGLHRHPVAETWYGEGLALLGDAAHPTLPFLAQGANLALEDAWALSACLSGSKDPQVGLAAYQARRRGRACRVVDAATSNAWKYHLRHGPHRWAAHLGLRAIGMVAPQAPLRGLRWLYDHDETAL